MSSAGAASVSLVNKLPHSFYGRRFVYAALFKSAYKFYRSIIINNRLNQAAVVVQKQIHGVNYMLHAVVAVGNEFFRRYTPRGDITECNSLLNGKQFKVCTDMGTAARRYMVQYKKSSN